MHILFIIHQEKKYMLYNYTYPSFIAANILLFSTTLSMASPLTMNKNILTKTHIPSAVPAMNGAKQNGFIKIAEQEDAEFGVLVNGKGVEETYAYCAACHSERIVAQQGLSRDGWIELIEWMIEEQEMEPIEEPDYALVLDYLSKNYGKDRPNFPK